MGTSGSYTGSGGKPARDLRNGVSNWLGGIPLNLPPSGQSGARNAHPIPGTVIINAIRLIVSSGDPNSSGNGVGGAQRTIDAVADSTGIAAAASYAYVNGDNEVLDELGLNYDELRALGEPIEVMVRIVEAACGSLSDSTISHEEQRSVVANLAQWVLGQQSTGHTCQPEEIVRKAIALIIFEIIMSESGALMQAGERPTWIGEMVEGEVLEAAEVKAGRAELSIQGVTAQEFSRAIEAGIDSMRAILV